MSRARDIADFNASLFANDEISGDKVSGGTIGEGTFNGAIGSSATGIPSQTWAAAKSINAYDGSSSPWTVKWDEFRTASGFTYGPSDNVDSTQVIPSSTGHYFVNYTVNFWNEPPSGTEDDSGAIYVNFAGTAILTTQAHFYVASNPTTSHEGNSFSMSRVYQVSSTGGSNYFTVTMTNWANLTNNTYNETHYFNIIKLA